MHSGEDEAIQIDRAKPQIAVSETYGPSISKYPEIPKQVTMGPSTSQYSEITVADETNRPSTSQFPSIPSSSSTDTPSSSYKHTKEYCEIKKALDLNKLVDERLQRLEMILTDRLHECKKRLVSFNNLIATDKKVAQESFRYVNCGKPYFKDKHNNPAPDNDHTITIKKAGMFDFADMQSIPCWTVKDKTDFTALLLRLSYDIKKKELNSKLTQLRQRKIGKYNEELRNSISSTKKQIEAIKKKNLNEIALPIDQEYNWEAVTSALKYRHSAQEYRALWKLFLHPSINKSIWSKGEHLTLLKIAKSYQFQDWEKIAEEHNTGRTGYQCFVYYRTCMGRSSTGQKWTSEEEATLRRVINYWRENDYIPWAKVASSMENRTKMQVYNKYARLLEKRKGRFLPEEDAVILTCVDNFGTDFKRMMNYLPDRSKSQIRTRYSILSERTSAVWSIDEDKKLVQVMANNDSLSYSSLTEHFPGKNRVHIRARYNTLLKWMKKHPNLDISWAPRRGARRLGHGQASEDLNKAVENLNKKVQSKIKKKCKLSKDSSEDDIEDAIVVTLINEKIREDELKTLEDECETPVNSNLNVENLQKVLILLKSKLDEKEFRDSSYCTEYPNLAQVVPETCVVKIKSYSKKDFIKIELQDNPNIWGENLLSDCKYVFPPNYATLTGCRKLMAYVSDRKQNAADSKRNIKHMMRMNVLVKDQMRKLMDRFSNLFLWPMLLSDERIRSLKKV